MSSENLPIENVSDTALWVAYYRGLESKHDHPLFEDRLAQKLAGEKGRRIAEHMGTTSRYTQWNVVTRTWIIDRYIQMLIQEGVDTILNLGAGLDTRPYRLNIPSNIRWIEVDYPHMIEYKEKILQNEKPRIELERVPLDLSDREKRRKLFENINSRSKKVLVITEGVIIYLKENQVTELAEDLFFQNHFQYWIAEYMSVHAYPYFNNPKRMKKMKNAPFQFFPKDWLAFFDERGWKQKELLYLWEEGKKLGRPMPFPWWAYFMIPFLSKARVRNFQKQFGYAIFERRL